MPRGENRPSVLLTREENEQVFSLIGPKCQSLATTVVQLFTTEGPAHSEWKKKDTGVLCLIKDNLRRSYFFRIYCLNRKTMIWQHEVYIQIEYKSPKDYLHTFEAEEYMTAFNFANTEEARVLRNILIEKIELRKQKREERRQRSMLAARANTNNNNNNNNNTLRHNGAHAPVPPPPSTPAPAPPPLKAPVSRGNYGTKNKKGKLTRKITKHDIGMPQNFQHVSHIGWNAERGFDLENVDEQAMNNFFSKAGISETQLQDQDTRNFIYDFINTHGGLDAVKEELHDEGTLTKGSGTIRAPPPVPTRSPAAGHPPGPPSRAPPPPPSRALPPPPLRTPPPPRPLQPPTTAPPSIPPPPPPPAPPTESAPPPPPAPPAPPAPPPPPAPGAPLTGGPPSTGDPRAALMESIRAGNKTLKRVEVNQKTAEPEVNRGDLLSEIRQGIELRSVSKDTTSAPPEKRIEPCGLAGALQRALQERNRAIHSSDSDLSDETTSDGEWDE